MANPNTRETLKQYALRALGKPVIEINVDDDQLEDRLDEALQYYAQFHYDGIRRTYLKYKLTSADKTRLSNTNAISESATDGSVTTNWNEDQNYLIVPESVTSTSTRHTFFSSKSSISSPISVKYIWPVKRLIKNKSFAEILNSL